MSDPAAAPPVAGAVTAGPTPWPWGQRRTIRRLALVARVSWPVALVVWIFAAFGRLGFNPTDEGLILAQSYRIRLGQVPHRDILFTRPLGSALLHVIDVVLPGPLIEVSRLVAIVTVTAAVLLFATLIFDRTPTRWRLVEVCGAIGAVLLPMHTFPLMAWYTTDGLLFTAAGLLSIRSGLARQRMWLVCAGFALLGTTLLVKQSFCLSPALGVLAALLLPSAYGPRARVRLVLAGVVAAGAPVIAYVLWVWREGGFDKAQPAARGSSTGVHR